MTYICIKLKMMVRSPLIRSVILLTLFLGIVGGLIINTYQSRQNFYNIGIVDEDYTSASMAFIKELQKQSSLNIHLYNDRISANKALSDKKILQSYVILEGFESVIFSGKYDHVIEVVSMIKNPFGSWLNDQVSVSVIREWIINDGYARMLSVNSDYSRSDFIEAFNAYGDKNKLLSFKVIESDLSVVTVEKQALPIYMQVLLWFWCGVLFLFSMIFMRQLYIEKQLNIIRRHLLSGISPWYYHGVYLGIFILLTIVSASLFMAGFSIVSEGFLLLMSRFILASVFLSAFFYISIWLLNKLNFNLSQITLIYLCLFMIWSVLTIEAIEIFEIGKIVRGMSPLTLFFKICS